MRDEAPEDEEGDEETQTEEEVKGRSWLGRSYCLTNSSNP